METNIMEAIEALRQLAEDNAMPKKLKSRIDLTIADLEKQDNRAMRISRALAQLEDLSENNSIESFIRMELFNVVGLLEGTDVYQ